MRDSAGDVIKALEEKAKAGEALSAAEQAQLADAREKYALWDEGGAGRTALHALTQGVLGAAVSGALGPALAEKLKESLLASGMGGASAAWISNLVTQLAVTGLGSAFGGTGATTGASVDINNRQLEILRRGKGPFGIFAALLSNALNMQNNRTAPAPEGAAEGCWNDAGCKTYIINQFGSGPNNPGNDNNNGGPPAWFIGLVGWYVNLAIQLGIFDSPTVGSLTPAGVDNEGTPLFRDASGNFVDRDGRLYYARANGDRVLVGNPGESDNSPWKDKGEEYEKFLHAYYGNGNFRAGGREFDTKFVGSNGIETWIEAKSSLAYTYSPSGFTRFTNQVGHASAVAARNGANYLLVMAVEPPEHIRLWLDNKNIPWDVRR